MKKLNIYQKLLGLFLLVIVGIWIYIHVSGYQSGNLNYTYSFLFGIIPLLGGIVGIMGASIWGGLKSALGKAIFFVSLGLICWGIGETIWSYYNFIKNVPAPYPSLADLGFAPSVFFWVIGSAFLAHASGAWLILKRSIHAKTFTILAIIGLSFLSYYLLIRVARGNVLVPKGETVLKVILDIAYPLGDFLAAIFAFIVFSLSFKYFGGVYRVAIGSILLGLGTMYVGDFIFSYTTTVDTYYNADWGDLVLTLGLSLLTFGVLGFAVKPTLKKKAHKDPA